MTHSDILVATTTFAEKTDATEMAKRVVTARAAACVQIEGPIESHYWWDGRLCQDSEWRLTIKTSAIALARLKTLVHQTHPYELPQWVVVEAVQVSDGYRDWVLASTSPDGMTEV